MSGGHVKVIYTGMRIIYIPYRAITQINEPATPLTLPYFSLVNKHRRYFSTYGGPQRNHAKKFLHLVSSMAVSSFLARMSRMLKLGSVTSTLHVLETGNGQLSSGNASVHQRSSRSGKRQRSVILPFSVLARPPSGNTRRPAAQCRKSSSLCCGKLCSSRRIDLRRSVAWIFSRARSAQVGARFGVGAQRA